MKSRNYKYCPLISYRVLIKMRESQTDYSDLIYRVSAFKLLIF